MLLFSLGTYSYNQERDLPCGKRTSLLEEDFASLGILPLENAYFCRFIWNLCSLFWDGCGAQGISL